MLKHYVEILGEGINIIEIPIPERNERVVELKGDEFAYRFFDRRIFFTSGHKVIGLRENISNWKIKGHKITKEEAETILADDIIAMWYLKKSKASNFVELSSKEVVCLIDGEEVIET